ncbi:abnormal spindle-like microcephaly-associated protein homolog [Vespa mandarinia]|uniref:abnormal spindle-like microcephaly-associated protein homolog n=1 Tax=Vespa mandarinia TaxID=7446 RepID=UPI00160DF18D|nr:abnormal spindle-like microcephaly-associated protein homolog [Vespa mandarinia]XP_046837787.1 abnormal spindle-like microcephaly-associated protein homolog [Vespa crabro]
MSEKLRDDDTMKANTAATKIQANFRGYRVRKQLKETKPQQPHQKRQQSDDESTSSSTSTLKRQNTREALEEKSATKIQAGIRGFLVRKRQQAEQAAATRIQAGFRGFRTRKLLKQNGQ